MIKKSKGNSLKFNELPYYFSTKFDEEPFWGPEPLFSDISSTKSAFLCALPAGKAERAGRAERTRRAERAGVLSSQKKEGGQSGHPLEFCISAVGLLTLCLQVSCKMQGGVLQTPL